MNMYDLATKALKDAVKAALDDNVDAALQCELWRHYQGVKQIAKQLEPASTESSNVFQKTPLHVWQCGNTPHRL